MALIERDPDIPNPPITISQDVSRTAAPPTRAPACAQRVAESWTAAVSVQCVWAVAAFLITILLLTSTVTP